MKKTEISRFNANKKMSDAIDNGSIVNLAQALTQGADIHYKDIGGWTWLMRAVEKNKPNILSALLKAGAGIDACNQRGSTGVMICVENGRVECLDLLIRNGADLNATNEDGRSALIKAAINKETVCGKMLLAAGANPNIIDLNKNTAYLVTAQKGLTEFMLALFEAGADIGALNFQGVNAARLARVNRELGTLALAQALDLSRSEVAALRAAAPSPIRAGAAPSRRI